MLLRAGGILCDDIVGVSCVAGGSGWGVGGACEILLLGTGGAFGNIDIRFILLASVGLIVLAPKPVAWPGMTDLLLSPLAVAPGVTLFPGVVCADVCFGGSGVLDGVSKSLEACLLGTTMDFTLAVLDSLAASRSCSTESVGCILERWPDL